MIFIQRIFDSGLNAFVYYSKGIIDDAPLSTETTPNHTDNLVANTHSIIQIVGEGFLSVQDEGSTLTLEATNLNFTGAGVTATESGNNVEININTSGTLVSPTQSGAVPQLTGVQYAVLMENPVGTAAWVLLTGDFVGPSFAIASYAKTAPNGGTLLYRRGDTITGITASASYTSGPPDSASIANTFGGSTDVGDIDPGVWTLADPYTSGSLAGSVKRSGSDLGANPTMTATLTAIKGASNQQSTFVITWTRDVYYGVGAAGLSTEGDIEGLAGTALATSRNRTIVVSPANQKVYYSYPKSYGTATFTLNGFPFDMLTPFELSITNVNGVTSTYYVYESTNLLTGSNLNIIVT